jgi:hypothetical protein
MERGASPAEQGVKAVGRIERCRLDGNPIESGLQLERELQLFTSEDALRIGCYTEKRKAATAGLKVSKSQVSKMAEPQFFSETRL